MSIEASSLFKHMKLRTMGIFFTCGFILSALIFITSSLVINNNVISISSVWDEYKADKSEKVRIDSALRSALGYGGAIHEFKNYILRQEDWRIEKVQAKLGAVNSAIEQFNTLGPSSSEVIALNDIKSMVNSYNYALTQAQAMFAAGKTLSEVDQAITIDDTYAIRGLRVLSQELASELGENRSVLEKSGKAALAVTLRSALGYGGFIHHFKNAVLRGDGKYINEAELCLLKAEQVIEIYRSKGITTAESLSLEDISRTLTSYKNATEEIEGLLAQGMSSREIDTKVKIDDSAALRGLAILDRDIVMQIEQGAENVSDTLAFVQSLIHWLSWFTIIFTTSFIIAAILLIRSRLIEPVRHLTAGMKTLASGNLNIKVRVTERDNEIGEMARSLDIFRANALKYRDSEAQVKAVIDTAIDAIVTTDNEGNILAFNPAAVSIFDYALADILGRNVKLLLPKVEHLFTEEEYGKVLETQALRANGMRFPVEISMNEMSVGERVMFTAVIRDITDRKAAEAEIRKLAMTDPLTGLANRNQFEQRIEEAIQIAQRTNKSVGLMLIDLNKFKPVNDTYGHHVGDLLLQAAADRMVEASRQTDTVARLGGDEFAIILNHLERPDCIDVPVERITKQLSKPYLINDILLDVTASLGISMYPQDDIDIDELMRKADAAMYKNKNIDII